MADIVPQELVAPSSTPTSFYLSKSLYVVHHSHLFIMASFLFVAGAVSGVVVHRYGLRRAGAMGILLSFLGLSSSYFANGIIYLIMSVGIITG